MPLPMIAKRMGHGSAQVTMSIYAHRFSDTDQAAADAIDKAVGG